MPRAPSRLRSPSQSPPPTPSPPSSTVAYATPPASAAPCGPRLARLAPSNPRAFPAHGPCVAPTERHPSACLRGGCLSPAHTLPEDIAHLGKQEIRRHQPVLRAEQPQGGVIMELWQEPLNRDAFDDDDGHRARSRRISIALSLNRRRRNV